MPRVVRILVYKTETEEQMKNQLKDSLPDGKPRVYGCANQCSITAYTLNSEAFVRIHSATYQLEEAYNQLVYTAPRVAPGSPTGDGKEKQ